MRLVAQHSLTEKLHVLLVRQVTFDSCDLVAALRLSITDHRGVQAAGRSSEILA